jgi:hypothetical protein
MCLNSRVPFSGSLSLVNSAWGDRKCPAEGPGKQANCNVVSDLTAKDAKSAKEMQEFGTADERE